MSKRILAADDSRTIQKTLSLTFHKEDELDLTIVDCGQAVLDALNTGTYDLLLLDYRMPDIPGTELCVRLRQNPNTAQVPIILLGGQNFEPAQAKQVGASGLVRKPFLTSDLLDRVGELLNVSIRPIPAPMSARMGILQKEVIDIEIDVDVAAPVASTPAPTPTPAPAPTPVSTPTLQPSPFLPGTPAQGNPIPPLGHSPSASSQSMLASPPPSGALPSSTPAQGTPQPMMPPSSPGNPGGDMLIDDLPYDLPTNNPGGAPGQEQAAPQSPTGNLFFPVTDNVNAPPTTPFTPDYPRSPMPAGQGANPPSMFAPPTQAESPFAQGGFTGPGISKPLPPPSFANTGLGTPRPNPSEPTPVPHDSKPESMEVLIGTTMDPPTAQQAEPKELLLPLEDEHSSSPPSAELDPSRMDFSNPAAGGLPGRPGTPRIDHLQQTAVVPAVRRRQMAQDKSAPPLAPGANVLPELLEESAPPPRPVSDSSIGSQASGSLEAASAALQQGCPPHHCQLVFGAPLGLQTLAMFLQFASHTEKRLRSFLKKEEYTPITTRCEHVGKQFIMTFGGSASYLRCLMPTLLECCSQFSEEIRQTVAESLIENAPESSRHSLRRASLQARITSRPYALTLQHDLTELSKAKVLGLYSGLPGDPESLYESTSHGAAHNEEADLTVAKIKLRNILLRHFNLFSLNQLMEEEFSLPLQDIVPLNLSIQSIFLAVIHHFEQRYQLPELAGAIQDKHPSFEAQPFEAFPDI